MRVPRSPTLLRRMRDARLAQLAPARPFVGASLVQIHRRCGKPSCRCVDGEQHPAFLLTFKEKAKSRSIYVSQLHLEEVRAWVEEHRRLKILMSEISILTLSLLRSETRIRKENKAPPAS